MNKTESKIWGTVTLEFRKKLYTTSADNRKMGNSWINDFSFHLEKREIEELIKCKDKRARNGTREKRKNSRVNQQNQDVF